jgi:hypothetical protein
VRPYPDSYKSMNSGANLSGIVEFGIRQRANA